MIEQLQSLMRALEAGTPDRGGLSQGAALQVEDLEVTLKVVTFTNATFITEKKLGRLLKNLSQRDISYILRSRKLTKQQNMLFAWNRKLVVGKRILLFRVSK